MKTKKSNKKEQKEKSKPKYISEQDNEKTNKNDNEIINTLIATETAPKILKHQKQKMIVSYKKENIIIKYEEEVEILQDGDLEIGSEVTMPQEEEQSIVPLPDKKNRRKRRAIRKAKDKESE